MTGPLVHIRRILPDEGELLRAARLQAVRESPDAFGQSLETLTARTEPEWQAAARAASSGPSRAWLLAQADDVVVGLVLGRRRPPDTLLVFSMWTAPAVRRMGVGRALIETLEGWAGSWGARRSLLWVVDSNVAARTFYERLGFEPVTDGPDAQVAAQHASLAMWRPIGAPGLGS